MNKEGPIQAICSLVDNLETLFTLRLVSKRWCKIASMSMFWNPYYIELYKYMLAIAAAGVRITLCDTRSVPFYTIIAQALYRNISDDDLSKCVLNDAVSHHSIWLSIHHGCPLASIGEIVQYVYKYRGSIYTYDGDDMTVNGLVYNQKEVFRGGLINFQRMLDKLRKEHTCLE